MLQPASEQTIERIVVLLTAEVESSTSTEKVFRPQDYIPIELHRADVFIAVGSAFVKKGNAGPGIAMYKLAVEWDPTQLSYYLLLADALKESQNYQGALEVYRSALLVKPHDPDLLVSTAVICIHLGKFSESEQHLNNALEAEPRHTWAHIHLGILYRHYGRIELALSHHQKAVKIDGTHLFAQLEAGVTARANQNIRLAIEYFSNAYKLNPSEPQCFFNLAGVLRRCGEVDQAEQILLEAAEIHPRSDRIQFDLAFTRWLKDGAEGLEQLLTQSLEREPKNARRWFDKVSEESGFVGLSYARPPFGYDKPVDRVIIAALAQVDAFIHGLTSVRSVSFQASTFSIVPSGPSHIDWQLWWDTYDAGAWEPETLAFICRFVDHEALYIDVGAWAGPTALLAAARGAEVHAFEPDPISFSVLTRNHSSNPRFSQSMTIYNCAAGSANGDLRLYTRSFGNGETSVFAEHERATIVMECTNDFVVPMIDLCEFIRSKSPHRKRLVLKMDIEGAEYKLLPSIAPMIEMYDGIIHVSTHPHNIVAGSVDDTNLSRIKQTIDVLSAFRNCYWYNLAPSGIPILLDRTLYARETIMTKLLDSTTIIFSKSLLY